MTSYTCSLCGGTFQSTWSDAEARAEAEAVFPGLPRRDQAILCDVCYRLIMDNEHIQPDAELWRKRRRERAS